MLAKLVALDTSQREMSSLNVFCVMVSPTQPDYSGRGLRSQRRNRRAHVWQRVVREGWVPAPAKCGAGEPPK